MKSLLATTVVLGAIAAVSPASAQGMTGNWYVNAFGGYSNIGSIDTDVTGYDIELERDDSYLIGIAVGQSVGTNMRAEVELSYATYEGDGVRFITDSSDDFYTTEGDAALTYLLGNVWYDLPNTSFGNGAVPYIGGGLGVASLDVDTFFAGGTTGYGDVVSGLAYQVGAGVQFPMGAGMIDVAYRLKGARGAELDNNEELGGVYENWRFFSNNLQIGYVTKF